MAPSDYKSKKPKLIAPTREELAASPYFAQAHSLAKLLADPLKPVHIPAPPKGGVKELRAPRDMMKNVQGSSAGAGSGEFHVYRAGRRREYERLKLMDEQELLDQTILDTAARALEYETTAEQKTAKNRLKRQRQKNNARSSKKGGIASGEGGDDVIESSTADPGTGAGGEVEKKRKIGSGVGIKFTRPEDREDDDEEEKEEEEQQEVATLSIAEIEHNREVAAAVEAGITIRDD